MAVAAELEFLPTSHLGLLNREGVIQTNEYSYLIWDENDPIIYGVMVNVNLATRRAVLIVEAMNSTDSRDIGIILPIADIKSAKEKEEKVPVSYTESLTPAYRPIVMYVGFDEEGNLKNLSQLNVEYPDRGTGKKYTLIYIADNENPTVAVLDHINQKVPIGDKELYSPLNTDEIAALNLGQKGYPGELFWPKVFLSFALGKRIGPDDHLTLGAEGEDIQDLPLLTPGDVANHPLGPFLS